MIALVLSLLTKVTLVVGLGLILTAFLRKAPAALRHTILLGTLMSALLLPILDFVVPRWTVPVLTPDAGRALPDGDLAAPREPNAAQTTALVSRTPSTAIADVTSSASPQRTTSPASFLVLAWLIGTLAVLCWLGLGHLRLRSLKAKSWRLNGADWLETVREEAPEGGAESKIQLLCHPDVSTPLTWGSINPVIMLPEEALEWSDEHRRIVLRHELAHVARKDARSQLAAVITCAVYWFHPLVWMAERKLRAECERACDDRVIASGTPGPLYAAHLLEVARSARSFGGPGFLSVAMARPSELEGRLLAVLSRTRTSTPSRGARWLALALVPAAALVVSAFRPVPRAELIEIRPPSKPTVETPALTQSEISVEPNARAAAAAQLPASQAADSIFEGTVDVRNGGTLTLDFRMSGATITITGWDRPEVLVRGRLGGRNWRETRTTFEKQNGGAVLRNYYVGSARNTSFSHAFDIRVPRNFNVRLRSAGGGLSITGVNGNFSGSTGGGAIELNRVSGEADLSTGGGEITVTNSSLKGSVTTGGGAVRIDASGRDLAGHSGSGDVAYTNSRPASDKNTQSLVENGGIPPSGGVTTSIVNDNPEAVRHFGENGIQRHRSGGDIRIGEAPTGARVSTGGGAIVIGPSAGEVYATTGGGSISIGPASGSVIASTGAGNITVEFRGSGLHAADLTSGLGRIELILPGDINAELVLESAYTNNLGHKTTIESDWPLAITETDRWDASFGTPRRYVRSRQILGKGGGIIRVRTVNGNVVVRRAG